MRFDSIVILPAEMSRERFELIRGYGARLELTPGGGSNVKEICDTCRELRRIHPERIRVMNQFEKFANHRFHHFVTGNTIIELARRLAAEGMGRGVSAFVSAMGSAGTMAAGDRLNQAWPGRHRMGDLEPIQCPTLFANGYGGHDILGMGEKHATWIPHVANLDALMCIDDLDGRLGLQALAEEPGQEALARGFGVPKETARRLSSLLGISGVGNVLGAIKPVRFYGLGRDDLVVTVLTDTIDRFRSVLASLREGFGPMDRAAAANRIEGIFHRQRLDWIQERTRRNREPWHNLKDFTWVEQQREKRWRSQTPSGGPSTGRNDRPRSRTSTGGSRPAAPPPEEIGFEEVRCNPGADPRPSGCSLACAGGTGFRPGADARPPARVRPG